MGICFRLRSAPWAYLAASLERMGLDIGELRERGYQYWMVDLELGTAGDIKASDQHLSIFCRPKCDPFRALALSIPPTVSAATPCPMSRRATGRAGTDISAPSSSAGFWAECFEGPDPAPPLLRIGTTGRPLLPSPCGPAVPHEEISVAVVQITAFRPGPIHMWQLQTARMSVSGQLSSLWYSGVPEGDTKESIRNHFVSAAVHAGGTFAEHVYMHAK